MVDIDEAESRYLSSYVMDSFKVLWDGSISIWLGHHLASMSNKKFVEDMQSMRQATENDTEPPVTLLHGEQTQQVLMNQLTRIKVEQKQAAEEAKWQAKQAKLLRKQQRKEAGEEDEEEDEEEEEPAEEEEEEGEDGERKNKDEVRYEHMADFMIFDCCQFTTKLMQGERIKAIEVVPLHEKKSKFQK